MNAPEDVFTLPGCRRHALRCQVVHVLDAALVRETHHGVPQGILQGRAARDEHPQTDGAFCMQPLEVLQVPVEKGILVVPLDFAGDDTGVKALDVIHLV
jgi:hypothetical protein